LQNKDEHFRKVKSLENSITEIKHENQSLKAEVLTLQMMEK